MIEIPIPEEVKLDRIAQMRADIQNNMQVGEISPSEMFKRPQARIIDGFVDYFIDCIAELELKVEVLQQLLLEANGGHGDPDDQVGVVGASGVRTGDDTLPVDGGDQQGGPPS